MSQTHTQFVKPNGQHRIVVHNGGAPVVGQWAEAHQLATNGTLIANSGGADDALPVGVFVTRNIPHQQLA